MNAQWLRSSSIRGALALTACALLAGPAQSAGLPTGKYDSIRSEDVQWQSFPAFPEAAKLAVLVGNPTQPGPYVVRVKVPNGVKLMPHTHPEDRIYTVISGVLHRPGHDVRP